MITRVHTSPVILSKTEAEKRYNIIKQDVINKKTPSCQKYINKPFLLDSDDKSPLFDAKTLPSSVLNQRAYKNSRYVRLLKNNNIPNFAIVSGKGIRGESLSSRKNRRFLREIKRNGINTVIDLRDKFSSEHFPELCEQNGLEYYNIPVDSSSVNDREIIDNLPLLFRLIDKGDFYIACAQGLHRTDIALALNYVFNPNPSYDIQDPPILIGHYRGDYLKTEDISRRFNSIKKSLSPEDLQRLGWDESFEEKFQQRKKKLFDFSRSLIELE